MDYPIRVGIGYDVHRLVYERKLIIGGVLIDYHMGALGHSDADVLAHAIADAMLGAAALGNIGDYFPDSDIKNKDLPGKVLLSEVNNLLKQNNFSIINVDSTVILQSPKISEYIIRMRHNISKALQIDTDKVSVKATTTEKLGYIGKNEGIAAEAVVLLYKH